MSTLDYIGEQPRPLFVTGAEREEYERERDNKHAGLPVAGYLPQGTTAVALVNANKLAEEHVLRILDALATSPDTDKRWLAIGRTAIEQGFMAVNRAVFKPARVSLEG